MAIGMALLSQFTRVFAFRNREIQNFRVTYKCMKSQRFWERVIKHFPFGFSRNYGKHRAVPLPPSLTGNPTARMFQSTHFNNIQRDFNLGSTREREALLTP